MYRVDRLNKKYEKMVESAGGEENLGPMENTIKNLNKQTEATLELQTKEGSTVDQAAAAIIQYMQNQCVGKLKYGTAPKSDIERRLEAMLPAPGQGHLTTIAIEDE